VSFWDSKKKYHYFANICWLKSGKYQPSEYSWHGLGSLKSATVNYRYPKGIAASRLKRLSYCQRLTLIFV
jgi:hypothetical protein